MSNPSPVTEPPEQTDPSGSPEQTDPSGPAGPDAGAAGGGGAFDPDDRLYEHMSLRAPALAVLGIAVLIVVVGVVASVLTSSSATTLSIHEITIPGGATVPLTPAATALTSIVDSGQPPADIIGNLAVPSGSTVVRTLNVAQGAGTLGLEFAEQVEGLDAVIIAIGGSSKPSIRQPHSSFREKL